ncbi:hypothetical protein FGO68_gene3486 [Halteria grandinella]|uniref:Transmembrane protein n=1 Tax=Halteria grandinella TaxID=5974 RepID=A0A8J8T2B2_HALGN|nr:hypothetical protein FGO68_gene3486 [Halteria grandinella]
MFTQIYIYQLSKVTILQPLLQSLVDFILIISLLMPINLQFIHSLLLVFQVQNLFLQTVLLSFLSFIIVILHDLIQSFPPSNFFIQLCIVVVICGIFMASLQIAIFVCFSSEILNQVVSACVLDCLKLLLLYPELLYAPLHFFIIIPLSQTVIQALFLIWVISPSRHSLTFQVDLLDLLSEYSQLLLTAFQMLGFSFFVFFVFQVSLENLQFGITRGSIQRQIVIV